MTEIKRRFRRVKIRISDRDTHKDQSWRFGAFGFGACEMILWEDLRG